MTGQASGAVPRAEGVPAGRSLQQAKVAATGLAAVLLTLAVVQSALVGLRRVEDAADQVARLDGARASFQNADMMHDALYSGVLGALLADGQLRAGLPDDPVAEVRQDAERFRRDLRDVDAVELPAGIRSRLDALRPAQEDYIEAALRLVDPSRGEQQRRDELAGFRRSFLELRDGQDDVTLALGVEAEQAREVALRDQRSAEQRMLVAAAGALLGLAALSFWLSRVVRALDRTAQHERGVAETLQRMLLPEALPELPGVRMSARYLPSSDGALVGGDWYDVLALPGGDIGLVMGDVAGHDLRAASEMGQLRNALRAYAAEGAAPTRVLEQLNDLCFQQQLATIATCVYAVLDPVARSLTVVNAGHYPPLLLEPPRDTTYLDSPPSPPVGAVRRPRYAAVTHALPPDGVVLLYTDGLLERRGAPAEDGLHQLERVVSAAPPDVEQLGDHVLQRMFDRTAPQDDVALLVVAPAARLGDHLELTFVAEPASLLGLRRALQRWLDEAGASEAEAYEITVACSEAATNAVEHAYGPGRAYFDVQAGLAGRTVELCIRDWGAWRPPRGEDRGRGIMLMRLLMEQTEVTHGPHGTLVRMQRTLAGPALPGDPS